MRRLFVICLILLLPLNMCAVVMAASVTQADAPQHAVSLEGLAVSAPDGDAAFFSDAYPAASYDCQAACDIDPDEPPAFTDVHDLVNEEVGLRFADCFDGALMPAVSPRSSHTLAPLLKPPRAL